MAETTLNHGAEDFRVKLKRGEGLWLTVEDEDGDELVVRVVVDLPTGVLAVRVTEVGKEDEQPIDELFINFA
jgi:hypothetical protein